MKHSPPIRGGRHAIIASLLSASAILAAEPQAGEALPTGTVAANKNYVSVGSNVELTWSIQLPPTPPTLKPDEDCTMKVRLLGLAYGILMTNNGHGNNLDKVDSSNQNGRDVYDPSAGYDDERWQVHSDLQNLPVRIYWSLNRGSLTEIFSGDINSVNPQQILLQTTLKAEDRVDFGAQGWKHAWTPIYTTTNGRQNVVVLRDGDPLPETSKAFTLGLVSPYLKPYLDAGHKVRIGSRDLLVLWELDTRNTNHADFDLQDAAILVTFE